MDLYKKKYKEAMDRMELCVRSGLKISPEYIFSELAENKDERIRKALKQYFVNSFQNNGVAAICGVHVKDVLDWLEKQGEKHPEPYNGISFEYNGHIWGMCARDNGVDISCDKHLIKHLEKQGEQKPAGKVELKFKVGDKIYLKPEYRMPDDDTPIANTVKEIRRVDDKHYRFDGSYIFIEDQDKYELVEQKPEENKGNIGEISPNSEWSEEDETTKNNISHIIRQYDKISKRENEPCWYIGDCLLWMQNIKGRVQPKQEWSEEDEQHIDSLLKRLDALCRNKFERTRFAISEDRDWLKSLRPQNMWKPSEDDIIILEKLIKGELEPKVFQATLHGILEQLKKLKEE